MKLTKIIYSKDFIVFAMILAMLNNLEHSATVYHEISRKVFEQAWLNWALSILATLIIDISIIAFVVNNRKITAGVYAVALLVTNLLYYKGLGIFSQEINLHIAEAIFSAMFTYCIYDFVHLYLAKQKEEEQEEAKDEQIDQLQKQLESSQQAKKEVSELHNYSKETIEKQLKQLEQLNEVNEQLEKQNEAIKSELGQHKKKLTCEDCGYEAKTIQELNGHKKAHSKKSVKELIEA